MLEDELTELRSVNSSDDLITSKQKEIDDATRDAYLYATGMIIVAICGMFLYVWAFYFGLNIGMQVRIITMGAIYHKVQLHNCYLSIVSYLYLVCIRPTTYSFVVTMHD